jgi:hypothetical protein
MDQDMLHRISAPSKQAPTPRYSLVWKLLFIPKASQTSPPTLARPEWGTPQAFGSTYTPPPTASATATTATSTRQCPRTTVHVATSPNPPTPIRTRWAEKNGVKTDTKQGHTRYAYTPGSTRTVVTGGGYATPGTMRSQYSEYSSAYTPISSTDPAGGMLGGGSFGALAGALPRGVTPHQITMKRPQTAGFKSNNAPFLVDAKYRPLNPIGHGAYGVVCAAVDMATETKVAIKKVPNAFEDLVDAKRILREIKLLRHFKHENVCSLYDLLDPPSRADFNDVYDADARRSRLS